MNTLTIASGVFLGILLVISMSIPMRAWKRDETDGKERSGMAILTDHGTGVQYLTTPHGGLTVRVDKDGRPIVQQTKERGK